MMITMKRGIFFSMVIFGMYGYANTDKPENSDLHIAIVVQQKAKIPLGLVFVGAPSDYDKKMLDRLKKDLAYSGQCDVQLFYKSALRTPQDLKESLPKNIVLALFLTAEKDAYSWRLYDLSSLQMLEGKKVSTFDMGAMGAAHKVADALWPSLVGEPGSFGSKIAYCKQVWKKRRGKEKPLKEIWVADFDGSNPRCFINTPTINIAPRWSGQADCPLLFYSENTLSNVQLVMSNMFKNRQVVCSFDGINMQPTFSPSGKEVVFCLSKDGSSQLYHSYVHGLSKHRVCQRLTFNEGNNVSPCFIDDNHIVFVSDFETGKPQLYRMHVANFSCQRLTDGGYCVCPAYCKANNKLVYSKMVGPIMQLFTHDCATGQQTQITHSPGSKEEASWSVCGNYIIFGLNKGLKSRIAQLNMLTGQMCYITAEKDHCTYPHCSPIYDSYVGILKS